jgi:hypothetical protein
MHRGTQLLAPEGCGVLRAGETYSFLRNRDGHVLLVKFLGDRKIKPQAQLIQMRAVDFESGIETGLIVPLAKQSALPPWLAEFEGFDLSQIDLLRPGGMIKHASRVEERLLCLAPALRDIDGILSASSPDRVLNAIARKCHPIQNETRYRLWFYTYVCFGQNAWVLLPPFHNAGHHDRFEYPDSKQGRNNKAFGKHYGYGCRKDVIEKCIQGWKKHSGLGQSMQKIYERTMISEFKCATTTTCLGTKDFIQPNGEAIPTYWQFRYRVIQKFGLATIHIILYGEVRHRKRLAASKGPFSEAVANLVERVEADGYNTKELPKGFVEGSTLPALCVVIGRDILSGLKLGIGFSFGAERTTAYRAMLFSMAVPKDFFCSLFGITIRPEDWPSVGLPGFLTLDRGPGASKRLTEGMLERLPIREIAPSWWAQSKAPVESSHPRVTKTEGAPTYFQSDLTPVELAKQEIYRLLNYNHTADMSERFQPQGDLAFVPPSPIGLWEFYDRRGRNDAIPISIEDAVRAFLTPIELTVTEKGVWLHEQCYRSKGLIATGLLDKIKRSPKSAIKLSGYMLEMCTRYLWVEVEHQLIMLEAQLRMRDADDLLYLSLAELEQWRDARSTVNSAFRPHQMAATAATMQAFEADVGKRWEAGQLRKGKPKKGEVNRQEYAEARKYCSGAKVV